MTDAPRRWMGADSCAATGCACCPVRAWIWACVAALATYGVSMAPGLLWGDSGEAQLQVILPGWYVNGEIARSHPLYYMFARALYGLLPVSAPLAANLVCVLMGALTVANVACLAARLCQTKAAVFAAGATLLFSHTLWQLSTSAEVVTTTTALLSAELLFVWHLCRTGSIRCLALAALMNGLGAANHNFALLIWPVYAVVLLRYRNGLRGRALRAAPIAAVCFLLGALPVIALCVDDLRTFGSPAHTLESLLVGHYGASVSNIARLPALVLRTCGYLLLNFPTPLLLLSGLGAARAKAIAPAAFRWVFLGAAAVHLIFAMRYDVPDQHTFLVPTWLFVSMLIGLGVDGILARRGSARLARAAVCAALTGPLVYLLAPPVLSRMVPNLSVLPTRDVLYRDRWTWFLRPWRTGYHGAEAFARETFALLPEHAWLVVDATLSPPLNYLQVAQDDRRDVRLDCWIAVQAWFDSDAGTMERGRELAFARGLLYTTSIERGYTPRWLLELPARFEEVGHLWRVLPAEPSETADEGAFFQEP